MADRRLFYLDIFGNFYVNQYNYKVITYLNFMMLQNITLDAIVDLIVHYFID